jgi:SAM-dependent methyltransferase
MNSLYSSQLLSECLITQNPVSKILDFGQHSYADTFIAENQLHLSEPVFPLQLFLNAESGSIQLGFVSNDDERYNLYEYSYTSSNSKVSRNHWDEFADFAINKYRSYNFAVEIGSNDGYLIKQFSKNNKKILGVDCSKQMCDLANANDVNSIQRVFGLSVAKEIEEAYGKADIIMANNVFNHSNNPLDFAKAVARLLSKDGVFIFEVPYWLCMVESNRFVDMVYHEHISYFTVKSCVNLLKAAGLTMIDYQIVDYHGGSLRIEAKLAGSNQNEQKILEAIEKETAAGLFDLNFYTKFQKKMEQDRANWLQNFYDLLKNDPGAVVIGVGAAAKANTWLNWHRLDKTLLHCITDASKSKQGKYTPLSRIPIASDDEFAKHERPYALILSWNISTELKQILLKINPNIRFISQ